MRRYRLILVVALAVCANAGSVLAQIDETIVGPFPLDAGAAVDDSSEYRMKVATDGSGRWLAAWSTNNTLGGTIGTDFDLMISRSEDNGVTWTAPQALNTNAATDTNDDYEARFSTDGAGNWIVVWWSWDPPGGLGFDQDILFARSSDNGVTWTAPQTLNSYAATDIAQDNDPRLATDGAGLWIAVWYSNNDLGGTIGTDVDVFVSRSTDDGASWSPAVVLNTNAATDSGHDWSYEIATDGTGTWIVVWISEDSLDGTIGTDRDIVFARSVDDGLTWSDPAPLNSTAHIDSSNDTFPHLVTDGRGRWLAAWQSSNPLGDLGPDTDLLLAVSTDAGLTWSDPAPLNSTAQIDSGADAVVELAYANKTWVATWVTYDDLGGTIGSDRDILFAYSTDATQWSPARPMNPNAGSDLGDDWDPHIAGDGAGHWIGFWYTYDTLNGTLGPDTDPVVSRWTFCQSPLVENPGGTLLFPERCAGDPTELGQPTYDGTAVGVSRAPNDRLYLSSRSRWFAPVVVADTLLVNGADSGLGPNSPQPGIPPYLYDVAISEDLALHPPHELTNQVPELIPPGAIELQFELENVEPWVYGHTGLHIVRDCTIFVDRRQRTTIRFLSHGVEISGLASNLEVVTGNLSELRADRGFSRATCFGSLAQTRQVVDARSDPGGGDGYYYLVSGTCEGGLGYGDASILPDPRDGLIGVCP